MTSLKQADLTGLWKTDKGTKLKISEMVEIPAQKVWVGVAEDGRKVFFTDEGKPMFHDLGDLLVRRRGDEEF